MLDLVRPKPRIWTNERKNRRLVPGSFRETRDLEPEIFALFEAAFVLHVITANGAQARLCLFLRSLEIN